MNSTIEPLFKVGGTWESKNAPKRIIRIVYIKERRIYYKFLYPKIRINKRDSLGIAFFTDLYKPLERKLLLFEP